MFSRRFFRVPCDSDRARLGFEALEDRVTPAALDVAVLAARLASPTEVRFDYFAVGQPAVVEVGVYRSADATFDAGDEMVGAGAILTPTGGFGVGFAALSGQLRLDPTRDHVLVVADPNAEVEEFDEGNNTASFRKVAIAAAVHGLSLSGNPAEFLNPFAARVQEEGYDFVLPYVWSPLSQVPSPDATVTAGRVLAQFLRGAATVLAGPNDVVDVHLIGHSRGAVVVSEAFQDLTTNPGPRSLRLGYFKETLLDPHAARNFGPVELGAAEVFLTGGTVGTSRVGQFSFDTSNPLGQTAALAVLAFQAASTDPPAFVPSAVDEAEVYFQRLPADQTDFATPGDPLTVEGLGGVNLFGQAPVLNPALRPIRYVDLGPERVGHSVVVDWYLLNVVPTLGG